MTKGASSTEWTSAIGSGTYATSRHLIPDLPSTAEIEVYLRRMDAARWYSNFGPLVREFESMLRATLTASNENLGAEHVFLTTLSSGFSALEAGLRILGLPHGGRVLVPAVTFGACPLAVQHAGLEVALVDVDASTWVLTPNIARAAAARTDIVAIMPVAAYGVPLPAIEWDAFVAETGIPVIVDAAAAFETQPLLRHGLVTHSLHATKPLGIGEGGIVAGCNPHLIEKARAYTNFGMTERIVHADGVNAKMSEYHAAVGLAQLARWPEIKTTRRNLLNVYRKHLELLSDYVSLQPSIDEAVVSTLMVQTTDVLRIPSAAQNIVSGIAFHRAYLPPLHQHPFFERVPVIDTEGNLLQPTASSLAKSLHMRNSERLKRCLLGVPFHPFMHEEDVISVVQKLAALLKAAT